jgi:hypothetical protein
MAGENELEKMQKEVIVAQLFWHMPRGTEDNHENTSHSGWSIDRV